jgi:Integrase core domain
VKPWVINRQFVKPRNGAKETFLIGRVFKIKLWVRESFWSTLKRGLIHPRTFATRAEARAAIFEWIEVFYNRTRLHSALGFHSPVDFETKLN